MIGGDVLNQFLLGSLMKMTRWMEQVQNNIIKLYWLSNKHETQITYFMSCIVHEFSQKLRSKLHSRNTLDEVIDAVKTYTSLQNPLMLRRIEFLQRIRNREEYGTYYFEITQQLWYQCDMSSLKIEEWLSLVSLAGNNNNLHTREILKDRLYIPTFKQILAQV